MMIDSYSIVNLHKHSFSCNLFKDSSHARAPLDPRYPLLSQRLVDHIPCAAKIRCYKRSKDPSYLHLLRACLGSFACPLRLEALQFFRDFPGITTPSLVSQAQYIDELDPYQHLLDLFTSAPVVCLQVTLPGLKVELTDAAAFLLGSCRQLHLIGFSFRDNRLPTALLENTQLQSLQLTECGPVDLSKAIYWKELTQLSIDQTPLLGLHPDLLHYSPDLSLLRLARCGLSELPNILGWERLVAWLELETAPSQQQTILSHLPAQCSVQLTADAPGATPCATLLPEIR